MVELYQSIENITYQFLKLAQLKSHIAKKFKNYKAKGSEMPLVYHAGRGKVTEIDSKKLGDRDAGWYGAGFYVSFDQEYVKRWYGPTVSIFEIRPDSKILIASISASLAPEGLFNKVISNEKILLRARGELNRIDEISKQFKENQLEWVHAVDRLAEKENFDVVIYNDYEIIVKNPKSLISKS